MSANPRPRSELELADAGGGHQRTGELNRRVGVAPRVDWHEWFDWFRGEWKQGEHLSVIGPTGTGKTTLEIELAKIRDYVVFIATKPADELIASLENRGYTRVRALPRTLPDNVPRYLLWAPGSGSMDPASRHKQRAVIHDALRRTFEGPKGGEPGRWCVIVDECRYVSDPKYLGLGAQVNHMLIQGRSLKLSMVNGFQRPSWVPQEAYDQPSHLFIAADNDKRNARRFREIGGIDGERVAATIASLGAFEWAHVDARPGRGDVHVLRIPRSLAGRRGAAVRDTGAPSR